MQGGLSTGAGDVFVNELFYRIAAVVLFGSRWAGRASHESVSRDVTFITVRFSPEGLGKKPRDKTHLVCRCESAEGNLPPTVG